MACNFFKFYWVKPKQARRVMLSIQRGSFAMKLVRILSVAVLLSGVGIYGLPMAPLVILSGTLLWTLGEIVSAPSLFAYPALAGAGRL